MVTPQNDLNTTLEYASPVYELFVDLERVPEEAKNYPGFYTANIRKPSKPSLHGSKSHNSKGPSKNPPRKRSRDNAELSALNQGHSRHVRLTNDPPARNRQKALLHRKERAGGKRKPTKSMQMETSTVSVDNDPSLVIKLPASLIKHTILTLSTVETENALTEFDEPLLSNVFFTFHEPLLAPGHPFVPQEQPFLANSTPAGASIQASVVTMVPLIETEPGHSHFDLGLLQDGLESHSIDAVPVLPTLEVDNSNVVADEEAFDFPDSTAVS